MVSKNHRNARALRQPPYQKEEGEKVSIKEIEKTMTCEGHYRNTDVPCGWDIAVKIKYPEGRIEFKIFSGTKIRINNSGIPEIICPMCSHSNFDRDFAIYYNTPGVAEKLKSLLI